MSAFRDRLRRLRDTAGLSGREMAVFIGIAKSTMESWLRGSEPHVYTRRSVELAIMSSYMMESFCRPDGDSELKWGLHC